MSRSVQVALLVSLVLASAAGCGSSSATEPPPGPSMAGTWSGTYGTRVLTMTLASNAGTLSGTGTIVSTVNGSQIPVTITGTHSHPAVNMAFDLVDNPNAQFAGAFAGLDTVVGTVTEPAGDFALTFARE
jgi:hypothetical protein